LSKFGCYGNSLGSLEILDSIFEFADPENFTFHAKNLYISCKKTEISAILAYFLPKFGCYGNFLGFMENSGSIFEFTNP